MDAKMAQAQEEAEQLMNVLVGPAEQMLQQQGHFYPYGGALKEDGEAVTVGGMEQDEEPQPEELVLNIKSKLRSGALAGDYRATALVFPAEATLAEGAPPMPCIAFALEHRADYAVLVLVPWRLQDKELQFGEPFAQQAKREMFVGD